MPLERIYPDRLTREQKRDLLLILKQEKMVYCFDLHSVNYDIDCISIYCGQCAFSEDNREETIKLWEKELVEKREKKDKGWKETLKKLRGNHDN